MEAHSLAQHLQRFLNSKHNPETRTWYAKYLRPMVAYFGAKAPLTSITRGDADEYWQHIRSRRTCWQNHPTKPMQRRRLSPTTINNHLRAARTFWNTAVRQQLVAFNPFDHLERIRDTRPVEMKAISPEDLRAIWSAAKQSDSRDYAIITVMATVGLRAGELVSMSLSKLDLKYGTAWVFGKRGWRKVFLGTASVAAIQTYLEERPINAPDSLWLNVLGQPLTDDGVRQMVDRLADQAQVQGRHNLHAFRHRAAQAWLDNGANAEIVARALGHADVSITLSIYGNQDDQRVKTAIGQLELSPFDDPPEHGGLNQK